MHRSLRPPRQSVALLAALIGLWLGWSACVFDSSALADRPPCDTNADCLQGVCLEGTCYDGPLDDAGQADAASDAADIEPELGDATACEVPVPLCDGQIAVSCSPSGATLEQNCTEPRACSTGTCACLDGACVPRDCEPGARRCEGADVVECDPDGLGEALVASCGDGDLCLGGACVPAECTPGTMACAGQNLTRCSPAGTVQVESDCAANDAWCDPTQTPPRCVPQVCEPRRAACVPDAEAYVVCDDLGSATGAPVVCDEGTFCVDGACSGAICTPSASFCATPSQRAVCDDRGADFVSTACASGTYCVESGGAAACVPQVCVPNSTACTDSRDGVRVCDPFGSGWLATTPCSRSTYCDAAECVPQVCTPGAARCSSDFARSVCDAVGSEETVAPCAAGSFCDPSAGSACVAQVCTPGAVRCRSAATPEQCDARGAGWLALTGCGAGRACWDGVCATQVCTPGATSCRDADTELECLANGTATLPTACDPGSSCRSGACTPWACAPSTFYCAGAQRRSCSADGGSSTLLETCAIGCLDGACTAPRCGDGVVSAGESCDDANADVCDGCDACGVRNSLQIGPSTSVSVAATGYSPGTGDVTVEAWVRTTASDGVFVSLDDPSVVDGAWIGVEGGRAFFEFNLGLDGATSVANRVTADGAIDDGQWHHLAGVRTATVGAVLWVDGRLGGANTISTAFTGLGSTRMVVGGGLRYSTAAATLDEVRVTSSAAYSGPFAPTRRSDVVGGTTQWLLHFDDAALSGLNDSAPPGRDIVVTGASLVPDLCLGSTASARCGDGVRQEWEECDDGGVATGDGCGATCAEEPTCPAGSTIGYSGECYWLASPSNWLSAESACASQGGHLATISSFVESLLLASRYSTSAGNPAWIGINDRRTEGTYEWSSGEPVVYTRWSTGEPNNFGGSEDCSTMWSSDGSWNDTTCGGSTRGICER